MPAFHYTRNSLENMGDETMANTKNLVSRWSDEYRTIPQLAIPSGFSWKRPIAP